MHTNKCLIHECAADARNRVTLHCTEEMKELFTVVKSGSELIKEEKLQNGKVCCFVHNNCSIYDN